MEVASVTHWRHGLGPAYELEVRAPVISGWLPQAEVATEVGGALWGQTVVAPLGLGRSSLSLFGSDSLFQEMHTGDWQPQRHPSFRTHSSVLVFLF